MIVTIGGLPVFNALVDDEETGMVRISLVDDPAVESNFVSFAADRRMQMYAVSNEERHLVRGCVIRADFPIFRRDQFGEYYIVYKPVTIRQMAERYLLESRQNNVDLMHSQNDVPGVQLVQWFIKGDGISVEGFDDIAPGSLFAEFHVTDPDIWAAIKAGTYRGFSLEGYFDFLPAQSLTIQNKNEMAKVAKMKARLAKWLAELGSVSTNRGVLSWDGDDDLKEGDEVFIEDEDGNRNPAEDGEYITADNKTIVVVEGKVAEIRDPEAEVAPEEPADDEGEDDEENVEAAAVETSAGVLYWEGEGELEAGVEVFVEGEEGRVPAPDGEYVTSDGKVIVVVDGKVAEIRDPEAEVAPEPEEELRRENASLKDQIKAMKAELAAIRRQPAAKPAHEEVESAAAFRKTGNRGLDNLARRLAAK